MSKAGQRLIAAAREAREISNREGYEFRDFRPCSLTPDELLAELFEDAALNRIADERADGPFVPVTMACL